MPEVLFFPIMIVIVSQERSDTDKHGSDPKVQLSTDSAVTQQQKTGHAEGIFAFCMLWNENSERPAQKQCRQGTQAPFTCFD